MAVAKSATAILINGHKTNWVILGWYCYFDMKRETV